MKSSATSLGHIDTHTYRHTHTQTLCGNYCNNVNIKAKEIQILH